MGMEIRKAVVGDLKRIQELSLMLFEREYEEYANVSLNMDWSFGEAGEKYFMRRLTEEISCVFVVEDGGKIVGYLAGGELGNISWRNFSKMGDLDNMFVLEEFREKGVGRMLYGAFVDWCRRRGIKNVRVGTLVKNEEAVAFYEKMGLEGYELFLEGEI